MSKLCVHAYVSGKVQGVWFRQSTLQQALQHGVTGWARNLADGRVEVLLCGEQEAVAQVQAWLHEGSRLARVTGVEAEALDYQPIEGFATG